MKESTEQSEGDHGAAASEHGDDRVVRSPLVGLPSEGDRRRFLGWTRALPDSAADWFLAQHETGAGEIDASAEVWVFPGARAGREFLRRIHDGAELAGRPLIPPMAITPGRLDEVALAEHDAVAPAATELEVRSAWAAELALADESRRTALLGSTRVPSPNELWNLAAGFAKAVSELRGEGLEPQSYSAIAPEATSARWKAIAELDRCVAARLDSCGLCDPGIRRQIVVEQAPIRPVRIVTAGVLEWSGWQRAVLERTDSTVLVMAPETCREDFDALGAVVPDRWIGRGCPIPESSVLPVASPEDAATAMLESIERWSAGRSTASITVGLADATLAMTAARAARSAGLLLHVAEGEPRTASAPGRMIAALVAILREPTAQNAAALLRHPHVAAWAARSAGLSNELGDALPSALSMVLEERLPRSFADLVDAAATPIDQARVRTTVAEHRARERVALHRSLEPIDAWCGAWTSRRDRSRAWAERFAAWLGEVGVAIDEMIAAEDPGGELRRHLVEDHRGLGEAVRDFTSLPEPIDLEIEGADWLERLLERLAESREAPMPEPHAIEALGWLELAADPAPCLVLLGMHDDAMPGATPVDPLLPERVRERLGLGSARRREARDAAILAMLAARCEHLDVIVPLKDAEGKALLPSRLLLHGDGTAAADRVIRFTSPQPVVRRGAAAAASGFRVPAPDPTRSLPEKLSVTALRQYLADPRRFELRNVERLREVADAAGELDPLRFGTLAHAVLEQFGGESALRHETEATRIRDRLDAILDEIAAHSFGGRPRAAILVQLRNLRRRLHRFAEAEAASRASGWETRHVELQLEAALEIGPSEDPQPFTARIDRIDRHRETGRFRVLDYKTGDEAADPEKNHLVGRGDRRRWIDLQLPVYRHLLAVQLEVPEDSIEVGYVRLARSGSAAIFRTIESWGDEVFDEAIRKAREVVRAIRARRFPMSEPPAHPDAFSNLLHEPVLPAELGGREES
ncbi:MAG: PD-(D/E)XK nuclease family protein [Phycisphaerales bacterium]